MSELSRYARQYREMLLADPYRPGYHFALPDGDGRPADSNGAFYADGRYHLMYLYRNETTNGYHWGHISSLDLLHWRSHPDALTTENGDEGCFSGGAFVDEDGTAYLTFWKFPSRAEGGDNGGIDIAFSRPPYEKWERIRPIAIEGSRDPWGTMDIRHDGFVDHVSCADPSNIWKHDGWYYMQAGNKCVLDNWGRDPDSEERYRGDWTDLFRSRDLYHWEFVHRFYVNAHLGEDWPDETEDDMCPSFLPLPDRAADGQLTEYWLQMFISHNKGGQYYIGRLDDETFLPEQHGRFTWIDNAYFAPEGLIDHRNRQIGWFWLLDNPSGDLDRFGWTGVYGFPRVFWLEDGCLHMAPAEELDRLQYNAQSFAVGELNGSLPIAVKNGASFRLKASIEPKNAQKIGFTVCADEENGEYTEIYADRINGVLVVDTSSSGCDGRKTVERAPFVLSDGETLDIDIFVDRSVIEVYVNDRQAICRRVYPTDVQKAVGVTAVSDGADYGTVSVWEMMETNFY